MWESDEEDDPMINFDPTDKELINDYLMERIVNRACGEYIVDKDVYAKEPWLLDHYNKDNFFKEDEWFYFVTRTRVSDLKIGCGKKSKRKITGDNNDRGNWKANAKKYIIDEKTRKIIGIKQTLTFNKSNKKKQKMGDGSSTCPGSDSRWIMKEYMLPEGDKFQELVLCKIKKKNKSKKKDDHDHDHEASGLIAAGEGIMPHQSHEFEQQLIGPVNDEQVHTDAPLGHDSSLRIQETANEEYESWIQYLESDFLMNHEASAAGEGNMAHRSELAPEQLKIDDQFHTNTPLGHGSYLPIQEAANEEEEGYIQYLLRTPNDQVLDYNSSNIYAMDGSGHA